MLTEEQITQLKQDHGEDLALFVVPSSNGGEDQELVFKKAAPKDWADFQDSITKERGTRDAAFRRLSHACRVHPDAKTLEDVFRRYSALPTKIAGKITNMSGQGDEFEVKKL